MGGAPYDQFWGCGKSRKGHNKLGELLMELRKELRTHNTR
ncbi:hypothetical protein [Pontibacillus sp. ALD_SL1]